MSSRTELSSARLAHSWHAGFHLASYRDWSSYDKDTGRKGWNQPAQKVDRAPGADSRHASIRFRHSLSRNLMAPASFIRPGCQSSTSEPHRMSMQAQTPTGAQRSSWTSDPIHLQGLRPDRPRAGLAVSGSRRTDVLGAYAGDDATSSTSDAPTSRAGVEPIDPQGRMRRL